ncbi:MADS-box transcription factor PHERES 2-like [Gastrolobium bilobum]|uniref:MADS-box transcription factor PHERES 2-like n=1 Tax=Gastrolobium bilobum TaxID=150636 RepID=UPI002AB0967F|nr:MADS-box transcription factor PHERES 2-like [Gastrolobium bilobum]
MGRKRLPMELIQNEKDRKTTFLRRKRGLIKKVYEFATLCGVDVCAIIYASNFEGQEFAEPETWPQDKTEVCRIIQKYLNSDSDRRPKVYDMQEYYKDRIRKVEAEIFNARKERLKIMCPTWDYSFNTLTTEQLNAFVSMLDAKIDACNKKLTSLKPDPKGKAIEESDKGDTLALNMASNTSSHLNFMMSQPQPFPLHMKAISVNNKLSLYPFHLGQSSQSSELHFGQNLTQLVGNNGIVGWGDQVGPVTHIPKNVMLKEDTAEKIENHQLCYYNGNIQTMQPNTIAPQTLPFHEAAYTMLQGQMFNCKQ